MPFLKLISVLAFVLLADHACGMDDLAAVHAPCLREGELSCSESALEFPIEGERSHPESPELTPVAVTHQPGAAPLVPQPPLVSIRPAASGPGSRRRKPEPGTQPGSPNTGRAAEQRHQLYRPSDEGWTTARIKKLHREMQESQEHMTVMTALRAADTPSAEAKEDDGGRSDSSCSHSEVGSPSAPAPGQPDNELAAMEAEMTRLQHGEETAAIRAEMARQTQEQQTLDNLRMIKGLITACDECLESTAPAEEAPAAPARGLLRKLGDAVSDSAVPLVIGGLALYGAKRLRYGRRLAQKEARMCD